MRKILSFLLFIFLLSSLFTACGSQPEIQGVPDSTAELVVLDYLDEHNLGTYDYNRYNFEVAHNYDKSSNSDAAVIYLNIEYNYACESLSIPVWYSYDRTSDIWSLIREGSPSEPTTAYLGDNLKGEWYISNFNNDFQIKIQSLSDSEAMVNYSAVVFARAGQLSPADMPLFLEGEGLYPVENGHIEIQIDLPEGIYCQESFDTSKTSTAPLSISIHRQLGLDYGFIDGTLLYQ